MTKIKYFTILLLIIFTVALKAQIPIIKSNVANEFKNNSLVYKTFHNKYDLLIAYRVSGGWRLGNTNYIEILALKKNSWKKIMFSYPDNNPSKKTINKSSLDKLQAKRLMEELERQNFWTLSNDSINMRNLKPQTPIANYSRNDTLFIVAKPPPSYSVVLDGSGYHFEILQGDNLRSYDTQDMAISTKLSSVIKSRIKFIKSKNAFENALK